MFVDCLYYLSPHSVSPTPPWHRLQAVQPVNVEVLIMFDLGRCASRELLLDPVFRWITCIPFVTAALVVAVKILRFTRCRPKWTRPFVEEPNQTPSLSQGDATKPSKCAKSLIFILILVGLTMRIISGLCTCWDVVTGLFTASWVGKL